MQVGVRFRDPEWALRARHSNVLVHRDEPMNPRPARKRWLVSEVHTFAAAGPEVQMREARDLFKPLLMHPGRNVARTMKHAPNVDAVFRFDVEPEVRKPPDGP